MAGEAKDKKKRPRYLPHNKPVKKGTYPLRPGVEGFFLTCDGGREHQATREAINLLENFYEEIVEKGPHATNIIGSVKPLGNKIVFDDEEEDDDDDERCPDNNNVEANLEVHEDDSDNVSAKKQRIDPDVDSCLGDEEGCPLNQRKETEEDHIKKQFEDNDQICHPNGGDAGKETNKVETESTLKEHHLDSDVQNGKVDSEETREKRFDELLQEELEEYKDTNKRHFVSLDSGCNGIIFVKMNRTSKDPSPSKIVEHLMSTAAATKKHMSRFILRMLPIELACYASVEEISKAIEPLIANYFPADGPSIKFAVVYDARANTGIERIKIIDAVAKSVPQPHKVDLSNPEKTIVVQIAKTVCLIGVVQRYKELLKYNLRQLTSSTK